MLRVAMLLAVLGIVGCAQQPEYKPTVSNASVAGYMYQVKAAQVVNGMSEAEVIALMGAKPSSSSAADMPNGKINVLGWSHYNAATRKAYVVYFQFLDGKVNGRSESGM